MTKGTILLAAGGTGGHLFPAEALAHELKARGYSIQLATDARADRFSGDFPADGKHIIRSATTGGKNPISAIKTLWVLFRGYRESRQLMKRYQPLAAIGFGGYPTLPPIYAAAAVGVPCVIHEQNAVLGRANRMLAAKVRAIAVGFKQVGERPSVATIETGNPVRPMVQSAMDRKYKLRKPNETFRFVVFGGSQGARFFSEVMPKALALLPAEKRKMISLLQQAREEDEADLRSQLSDLSVSAEIAPFFRNMPQEIADAHFVMGRAGASTVTECAVIGRPSILIPLPGSLDGDQAANAIAMQEAGGAFVVKQSDLTPERLAKMLSDALHHPDQLLEMAKNAKKTGIPDAAKRLADCVECVISGGDITQLGFNTGIAS